MTALPEESAQFHIDHTFLGENKLHADDFLLARILANSHDLEKQSQRLLFTTRRQLLEDIDTRYTTLLAQIKSINLSSPGPYPFLLKILSDETLKRLAKGAQHHGMVTQADIYLEAVRNPEEKDFLLHQYHQSQLASLKQTLNYLTHEFAHDIPFIYYILFSVLHYNVITTSQGTYALSKRSPTAWKDFEVVDAGTAQLVYEAIQQNLPQHPLIINHEAHQCNDLVTPEHRAHILTTYAVDKRPLGTRLKFPQGNDPEVINDFYLMCRDSRKYGLSNWCSGTPGKSIAKRFLELGDCWRFVDEQGITQLGMRYDGNNIAEPPRGMLADQEVDPRYHAEVTYFLRTYPGGAKWLKNTSFAKLYEQYKTLTDLHDISDEDLLNMSLNFNAGDGSYNKERSDEKRIALKQILQANRERVRSLLGKQHNVDPTTIAFGQKEIDTHTRIYLGSTLATGTYPQLRHCSGGISLLGIDDFIAPELEIIEGYFHTGVTHTVSTPLLKTIEGDLDVGKTKVFSAPALTLVEGDVVARDAPDCLLPALTTVGGYLFARHAITFSAPQLRTVGGDLRAPKAEHLSVPQLTSVGGSIYTPKTTMRDTPLYTMKNESKPIVC